MPLIGHSLSVMNRYSGNRNPGNSVNRLKCDRLQINQAVSLTANSVQGLLFGSREAKVLASNAGLGYLVCRQHCGRI